MDHITIEHWERMTTREELLDRVERMSLDELTAYSTEALVVATIFASALQERSPAGFEAWSAIVDGLIGKLTTGAWVIKK